MVVLVWDITFHLPGYLLSGAQQSLGRDGEQDVFNLAAPGGETGVKPNASFIFGMLSRCLEDVCGIIEPCKGVGSHSLDRGPSPKQA